MYSQVRKGGEETAERERRERITATISGEDVMGSTEAVPQDQQLVTHKGISGAFGCISARTYILHYDKRSQLRFKAPGKLTF